MPEKREIRINLPEEVWKTLIYNHDKTISEELVVGKEESEGEKETDND